MRNPALPTRSSWVVAGTTTPPDPDLAPAVLAPLVRDDCGVWWVPGDRWLTDGTSWTEVGEAWVLDQIDSQQVERVREFAYHPGHLLVLLDAVEWLPEADVRANFATIATTSIQQAATAAAEGNEADADILLARASRARGGWFAAHLAQFGIVLRDPTEPLASREFLAQRLRQVGEDALRRSADELPDPLKVLADEALVHLFGQGSMSHDSAASQPSGPF